MDKIKIAFLGIDGSGKSTVSDEFSKYLVQKGYDVKIVPFHKWVFADKLRSAFGRYIDKDRKDRNSPYSPQKKSFSSFIKPPIAFIDNVLFYWLNAPKKKKQVFIYDRFICATQIKFMALNYRVKWFKFLWWNIKPDYAFIFDVSIEDSLRAQIERKDPYLYTEEQLSVERNMYLAFAKKHNFPIIQRTSRKETFDNVVANFEENVL
jgi:thymidylate kinase